MLTQEADISSGSGGGLDPRARGQERPCTRPAKKLLPSGPLLWTLDPILFSDGPGSLRSGSILEARAAPA